MLARILLALTAAVISWLPASATAAYPEQTIKVLVPFPPGGTVDTLTRQFAEKFSQQVKGSTVIIDNRPGAGGTIAGATVARAPADGYSLFMGTSSTLGIAVYMQKNLPYAPTRDFTPIAMFANAAIGIYVNPERIKARTLDELLQTARASGKPLSYGSPGIGTAQHLAAELLWARTGVKMTHVAYKGTPPSITDLVAGHIDIVFGGMSAASPFIKSGKLVMIAVASGKRSAAMPSVPAVAETVKGYEAPAWIGLVGPKGLPAATVALLEQEARRFASDPAARGSLAEQGLDLEFLGSADFGRRIAQDMPLWEEAVKAAGLEKE